MEHKMKAINKQVDALILEYSKIFEIKDKHGKYKPDFVEEVLQRVVNLEKKVSELQKKDCNKCKHKYDGTYTMKCFECKEYYASQFEGV